MKRLLFFVALTLMTGHGFAQMVVKDENNATLLRMKADGTLILNENEELRTVKSSNNVTLGFYNSHVSSYADHHRLQLLANSDGSIGLEFDASPGFEPVIRGIGKDVVKVDDDLRVGLLAGQGKRNVYVDGGGLLKADDTAGGNARTEHFMGSLGFHDSGMRSYSKYNGLADRSQQTDYAFSIKTHDYIEVLVGSFLMTHGEDRSITYEYSLDYRSGNGWVTVPNSLFTITVNAVGTNNHYDLKYNRYAWAIPSTIPNGTAIRFKAHIRSLSPNSDNSYSGGFITAIHANNNVQRIFP